jgi:hypothetical protein
MKKKRFHSETRIFLYRRAAEMKMSAKADRRLAGRAGCDLIFPARLFTDSSYPLISSVVSF